MRRGPRYRVTPAHAALVELWLAAGASLGAALAKAGILRRTWYRYLARVRS